MQEKSLLDYVALLAKKACGNILKDQGDRSLIHRGDQRPVPQILIPLILR